MTGSPSQSGQSPVPFRRFPFSPFRPFPRRGNSLLVDVDRKRLYCLYWLTIAALKTDDWPSRAGFVKREIVH